MAIVFAANTAKAQWVDDLYAPPIKKTTVVRGGSTDGGSLKSGASSTIERKSSHDAYAEYDSYANTQNVEPKELITSYEEALARRISAMRNATYEQSESYWKLMEQYQAMLEKKYNQKLYNIVVVGDEMWVEPKVITALFNDSDPTEGLDQYNADVRARIKGGTSTTSKSEVTINLVVDPFYTWTSWGYPRYRSWDYYWDLPYYYGSYYPPHYSWHDYYRPYWNRPYWGNYYYPRNPRGTYYGNSNYHRPGYYRPGWNNGTSSSRPSYRPGGGGVGGNNGGLGGGRPIVGRPNGGNMVDGIGGRPIISTRPNVDRPNASGRPNYERPTTTRPGSTTSRPTYERPTTTRPGSTTSRPTYERPTTTRPGSTTSRPTYERPTTTRPSSTTSRPTYERPTTTSRPSTPVVSRPSGSSMGGSSRPVGGGGGSSRPVGGGGRSR